MSKICDNSVNSLHYVKLHCFVTVHIVCVQCVVYTVYLFVFSFATILVNKYVQ